MYPSSAQASEVRRCARCQEAAVVLIQDWQHTVSSIATGQSTRDYQCQACGARFRIRPRLERILGLGIGIMAGLTVIGIPLFVMYWRRYRMETRLPVVPDAPAPEIRYPSGPPLRRCAACGAPAKVFSITRHTHNGLPSGTDYAYRCSGCQRELKVQSVWGIVLGGLIAILVAVGAWAFLAFATSPGWRWGGAAVTAALALLLAWQTVTDVRTRAQNPVLTPATAASAASRTGSPGRTASG
jgi:DNA-directed RNA polymerase subunit RPC12/RpoP